MTLKELLGMVKNDCLMIDIMKFRNVDGETRSLFEATVNSKEDGGIRHYLNEKVIEFTITTNVDYDSYNEADLIIWLDI